MEKDLGLNCGPRTYYVEHTDGTTPVSSFIPAVDSTSLQIKFASTLPSDGGTYTLKLVATLDNFSIPP